jgi:integrase
MTAAVDAYLADMRAEGRINSDVSERSYRDVLNWHAEDVSNRDPRYTNRDDVKGTLARWPNPNTRAKRLSYLRSFYDWLVEEGMRPNNPARQVRKPKRRPTTVYKLTREETLRVLEAPRDRKERWAVWLLGCAGLRSKEARGLQGRHFARAGWIHVSADIAKGGKERWVPVLEDLAPVVDEVRASVPFDHFVFPKPIVADPGVNSRWSYDPRRGVSQQYLWSMVAELGRRARVAGPIGAHSLRHAFTDHVARSAGVRIAQALLGHADISTTGGYMSQPTLDELAGAVHGVRFFGGERVLQGAPERAAIPLTPPAGFEPAVQAPRAVERNLNLVVCRLMRSPAFRRAAEGMVS